MGLGYRRFCFFWGGCNMTLWIRWNEKNNLAKEIRDREKKIEKCRKKLSNPVNKRTGSPLAAPTIKKYQESLKFSISYFKKLKELQNSLLRVDIGNNDFFPSAGCFCNLKTNSNNLFIKNLIDVKKTVSESTSFRKDGLINMVKFIFNCDNGNDERRKSGECLTGLIVYYFNKMLDHIIEENSENQTPPKSKLTSLFPSIEDELDRVEKLVTEMEWKQSKIFSSEPIKKTSKHHLKVVK